MAHRVQRAFWGRRLQGIIAPTTMGIVGLVLPGSGNKDKGLARSELSGLVAECLLSMGCRVRVLRLWERGVSGLRVWVCPLRDSKLPTLKSSPKP